MDEVLLQATELSESLSPENQLHKIQSLEIQSPEIQLPGTQLPETSALDMHYVTSSRFDISIASAQASLHQLKSITVFEHRIPHMIYRGSYVAYICGLRLSYVNGVSVVLGQYGEPSDLLLQARITQLKVWSYEDEEDDNFQVRGLEFYFEGMTESQGAGIRHGSSTKTFKNIVSNDKIHFGTKLSKN